MLLRLLIGAVAALVLMALVIFAFTSLGVWSLVLGVVVVIIGRAVMEIGGISVHTRHEERIMERMADRNRIRRRKSVRDEDGNEEND